MRDDPWRISSRRDLHSEHYHAVSDTNFNHESITASLIFSRAIRACKSCTPDALSRAPSFSLDLPPLSQANAHWQIIGKICTDAMSGFSSRQHEIRMIARPHGRASRSASKTSSTSTSTAHPYQIHTCPLFLTSIAFETKPASTRPSPLPRPSACRQACRQLVSQTPLPLASPRTEL